jgi:hypothetical protein
MFGIARPGGVKRPNGSSARTLSTANASGQEPLQVAQPQNALTPVLQGFLSLEKLWLKSSQRFQLARITHPAQLYSTPQKRR